MRATFHRRLAALLAGLALSAAPAAAERMAGIGASPGEVQKALREHVLRTLDGKSLTLGSLRGEVVIVNFWASWCPPCRKELPALAALHAELGGQRARVLAVSIDEDLRNVQRFTKNHKLTLPIAHDGPAGLAKRLDLRKVPFTMVLGPDGAVITTASGASASEISRIESAARRLAAERRASEERPISSQSTEGATP
jgi:cytochrome c biogenesis protein CcmG, thiol:disulfide interchange protein DsbE